MWCRKMLWGVVVLCLVSTAWISTTYFIKTAFQTQNNRSSINNDDKIFSTPFLTSWFCLVWTIISFPMYIISLSICSCLTRKNISLRDSLQRFRQSGITFGKYLSINNIMNCVHYSRNSSLKVFSIMSSFYHHQLSLHNSSGVGISKQ